MPTWRSALVLHDPACLAVIGARRSSKCKLGGACDGQLTPEARRAGSVARQELVAGPAIPRCPVEIPWPTVDAPAAGC